MISDSLSSDSLISKSHLKLYFKSTNVNLVLNDLRKSVQTLKLWQMFLFFHNLAIRSVIILVILMMFLSLVQLQTELDSTQSYYLYLSGSRKRNPIVIDIFTYYVYLYYEIM